MAYRITIEVADPATTLDLIEDIIDDYGDNVTIVSMRQHTTTDEVVADMAELLPELHPGFDPTLHDDALRIMDNPKLMAVRDEALKILDDPNITTAMLDGLIADVRGVEILFSDDNAAMHFLDSLVAQFDERRKDVEAYEAHNAKLAKPYGKPVQGSGSAIPGLERVACPTCHAVKGAPCRSAAGKAYYPGWGHRARARALKA